MTFTVAKIAGALAACGLSFVAGAALKRPRVETREVTRDVVREVAKVEYRDRMQYVDREKVIRRVVRVVVHPDGTKVTESTTETDAKEEGAAHEVTEKAEKAQESSHEKETVTAREARDNWSASAIVGVRSFALRPWYGAVLSRRIAGGLALTAEVIYTPDEPFRLGGGLTWNW